jgi:hypothetical protein
MMDTGVGFMDGGGFLPWRAAAERLPDRMKKTIC